MSQNNSQNSSTPESKVSNQLIVAIIGAIALIIAALISYRGSLNQTEIPIQATQTAEAKLTAIAISAQPTNFQPTLIINTKIVPPTQVVTPFLIGYDFESGTQGWGSAEEKYKKAETSLTTQVVYEGNSSLQLDTELFGSGSAEFSSHNNDDVYRHTEAVVYMNNSIPAGYDIPGPYNLEGKSLSCFVYLPDGLAVDGPHTYVRLIAKDIGFRNQVSQAVDITKDTTNRWIELSFVAGDGSNEDEGFDAKEINALGVRLDSLDGSNVQYTGPIYIDNCTIK